MSFIAPPLELEKVASLLDSLGCELDALGAHLCADGRLVAKHVGDLQALDRIAQFQRELARILRAEQPMLAVRCSGLDDLKAALS